MMRESLDQIVARTKLPICVNAWFIDAGPDPIIVIGNNSETQSFNGGYVVAETFDPADTTRAYFDLVSHFPAPASPARTSTAGA